MSAVPFSGLLIYVLGLTETCTETGSHFSTASALQGALCRSFLLIFGTSVWQFLLSLGSCKKLRLVLLPQEPCAHQPSLQPQPLLRALFSELFSFCSSLTGLNKSQRWLRPCPHLNPQHSELRLLNSRLCRTVTGRSHCLPAKKRRFSLSPSRLCLHKQETSLERCRTDLVAEQKYLLLSSTGPARRGKMLFGVSAALGQQLINHSPKWGKP